MTLDQVAEFVEKPLRMIPHEFRLPAWKFWAHYAHLLPNQIALAMRLRDWIEGGLTLEDALVAFRFLTTPEESAEAWHAGRLLSNLARVVAELMHRREVLSRSSVRRVESPVSDVLNSIGKIDE
jgi:hypothetical protein